MSVSGKYQLENVPEVYATLTLTMTVKEWKDLLKVLGSGYPEWDVARLIRELVTKAESSYSQRISEPESSAE